MEETLDQWLKAYQEAHPGVTAIPIPDRFVEKVSLPEVEEDIWEQLEARITARKWLGE